MTRRFSSILLTTVIAAIAWGERSSPVLANAEEHCIPTMDVTSSLADEDKSAYKTLHDGNPDTYLKTSAKGWHFVQFDFGCDVDFQGLRRYMTRDGKSTYGSRESLGEGILDSRDGISWLQLTDANSKGWDKAKIAKESDSDDAAYRGFAWQALPYGWSPRLSPAKAVRARFVRFNVDVASDRLNQFEVQYERPAAFARLVWDWSDWNWAAPEAMVHVRYDADDRREEEQAQPVDLPWNDVYGPCREEHPDVDPADGWALVAGNFGTDLFARQPDYPYFILYNRYRGMMRSYVFYGARRTIPHEATHQMGTLLVEDGDVAAFTHFTGKYLHDFNPRYEQVFMKKRLLLNHWACLEHDVTGYDPDLADPSKAGASFLITFDGMQESVLTADIIGGLDGTLEAADVRTGKDGLSGAFDAVTTAGGTFLNAVAVFTDSQDAIDKMQQKGDDNPMEWWGPVLSQAASLATQNTVPLLAAAAGFLTNLIDGDDASKVPLSYRAHLLGEFRLNGTIQTVPTLGLIPFYVPGTTYGSVPEMQPLYHEPLGIYSLRYAPVLEWWSAPSGMAQQLGGSHGVGIHLDTQSVVVNPSSGLSLHSIDVALVSAVDPPSAFVDASTYIGLPMEWMGSTRFNRLKVGVRLTFARIGQPNAPLVTFYREYEPTRESQGTWAR